jgi:hypothetical protein
MRYVWIGIIAASGAPLLYAAWFANPLSFILLGPERWHEGVARLHPHRWRISFLILVCAFSVAVYTTHYWKHAS